MFLCQNSIDKNIKSSILIANNKGEGSTMNTVQTTSNIELAIAAKALRTSFNTLKDDIMKESYMDDEFLIEKVRRMQSEYKLFKKLADRLEENDFELYKKELLS